jgi:hypothetical protein
MPDDDRDEPTDLSAIRRDHELIEAFSTGDLDAAHALADPDDPLIALFDQAAECVANFRARLQAALDLDPVLAEALLAEAHRTLRERRRSELSETEAEELAYAELAAERRERAALAARRRRLRTMMVVAPLVVAVGVAAWRRLR